MSDKIPAAVNKQTKNKFNFKYIKNDHSQIKTSLLIVNESLI